MLAREGAVHSIVLVIQFSIYDKEGREDLNLNIVQEYSRVLAVPEGDTGQGVAGAVHSYL